jgi:carbonic anhydrase
MISNFLLFSKIDPNKWTEHNSLCKGAHQSPIDIETRNTIVSSYPDISFFNYDKSYPENLENNGHTGIILTLFII